jgi:hypothetical protein
MRTRNLALSVVLSVIVFVAVTNVSAQDTNPRFGVWRNQSNPNNVMTYEPYGDGGMKITVATTRSGNTSEWSYVTLFDGVFRPVQGQENVETAVEFIDEQSTRIYNKRNGLVGQVIINTLSEDGNTINNEYVRMDADGKITGVGHAIYERVQ